MRCWEASPRYVWSGSGHARVNFQGRKMRRFDAKSRGRRWRGSVSSPGMLSSLPPLPSPIMFLIVKNIRINAEKYLSPKYLSSISWVGYKITMSWSPGYYNCNGQCSGHRLRINSKLFFSKLYQFCNRLLQKWLILKRRNIKGVVFLKLNQKQQNIVSAPPDPGVKITALTAAAPMKECGDLESGLNNHQQFAVAHSI